jgi:hypothetical protein
MDFIKWLVDMSYISGALLLSQNSTKVLCELKCPVHDMGVIDIKSQRNRHDFPSGIYCI